MRTLSLGLYFYLEQWTFFWMHNSLLAGTSLRNYWLEFVTFILHKIEI